MLTFHEGNYDDDIEDTLRRGADDSRITTTREGINLYDKPADWMERNAIGLERIKTELDMHTIRLMAARRGERTYFYLLHYSVGTEAEPVVWHDPSIDPHWERLTKAFCDEDGRIVSICIDSIEMRKETVATLVASLCGGRESNPLQFIQFDNTNLCREGIVWLSTLVEQQSELQSFYLRYNRIDDLNSALCLSRALKPHRLLSLKMEHCDLGNDPEILSVILQSDVKTIHLSHNNIDSLGAVKISEYLEGNSHVQNLALDCNNFNDDDAILFSRALKNNTTLRDLYLRQNNFTSVGVKVLFASLFIGTSLNAISDCNHTCILHVFDVVTEVPFHRYLFSLNLNLDRRSKILTALDTKKLLIKCLADIPVGLVPDVLAFIQRLGNQIQSMAIMYGAMRWCMPTLYSFRHCVSSNTKRKRDD